MPSERPLRVDARRNERAVLDAARELFEQKGTDLTMEEVSRRAGVGKATLYRRFPTKDHLFATLCRDTFDQLAAEAAALIEGNHRGTAQALTDWLVRYDRSTRLQRGLRDVVLAALAAEDSAVYTDCTAMKANAGVLLKRAQHDGHVVSDIEITELLTLIAALPDDQYRRSDGSSRLFDVVMRGLETTPDVDQRSIARL